MFDKSGPAAEHIESNYQFLINWFVCSAIIAWLGGAAI